MQELRRRTITALIYAAVVFLAVAAPPIVLWIVLVAAGRVGLSELRQLRVGTPALVFGALFVLGLVCLGLLKAAAALGAGAEIADSLPVWLLLTIAPTCVLSSKGSPTRTSRIKLIRRSTKLS